MKHHRPHFTLRPFHFLSVAGMIGWLLSSGVVTAATTLVDWQVNAHSTEKKDFSTDNSTVEAGSVTYNYSFDTPRLSSGTGYVGLPIYVAASVATVTGAGVKAFQDDRFGVYASTSNDYGTIRFGVLAGGEGSGGVVMRGLLSFKREDFLPGQSGPVTFADGGSFFLNMTSSGGSFRQTKFAVYAQVDGE